jgi:hypothetical protein
VKAEERVQKVTSTSPAPSVDITGTWSIPGVGYLVFRRQGNQYSYQDCNLMGVVVAEGSATVLGNRISVQGYSLFAGTIIGELTVNGNIMNGYFTSMGNTMNFTLTKQSNRVNTGFNWGSLFS